MATTKRSISARHALTEPEFDFCKRILAKLPAAESYRRSFLVEAKDGKTYAFLNSDGTGSGDPIPSKEVSRRASTLLSQEHITAYIAELQNPVGDQARGVLLEQAVLEGNRQAAEKILDDEGKMNARDDVEFWAMVMCAIGTEVVVDIPGGGEIVIPMKSMFPQFADALPPDDVVRKTIASLEDFLIRETRITEKVPE